MNALAALADPTRQRIVETLALGALTSGEIARRFPVSAPAISQHLKTLREARLVTVRGEAQRRIYALDKTGVDEVARWIENVQAFWAPKLDALEAALLEDNCHE
ncbi:MAG: metalloregulator ArsR/SmtB family transcription factor [Caulobacteraceae bacterium]